MAEANVSVTKEFGEGDTLTEGMWNVLEKMEGREKVSVERRKKQLEVLKNLPEDFDLLIAGFYQSSPDQSLHGEVFEYLVRADRDICPTPETGAMQELRVALQNPRRFKLSSIREPISSPDAIFTNSGNKITQVVEIKMKLNLDRKNKRQIHDMRDNLQLALDILKNEGTVTLKEHGLKNLAETKPWFEIAGNFAIVLAGPSDNDDNSDFNDFHGYHKKYSPFSKNEVYMITDFVRNALNP